MGAPDADPASRRVDLRTARLHLRTGSLSLARAELESLAGSGTLDDDGLLDLAEVRWRTGNMAGAGEAASAYLATGRQATLALVIAAEATMALGRPSEARRQAGQALEGLDGSLDRVFAGMPRSAIWPPEPGATGVHVEPFFPAEASPVRSPEPAEQSRATEPSRPTEAPQVSPEVRGPGLWDHDQEQGATYGLASIDLPDPRSALDDGRLALATGDRAGAAVRLALVLRVAPAFAPAVLDLLAGSSGADVELVRGDAYRAAGHESEALRAYAAAAAAVSTPPRAQAGPEAETSREEW